MIAILSIELLTSFFLFRAYHSLRDLRKIYRSATVIGGDYSVAPAEINSRYLGNDEKSPKDSKLRASGPHRPRKNNIVRFTCFGSRFAVARARRGGPRSRLPRRRAAPRHYYEKREYLALL